jgi:predicted PurR-regulated permease PerM
VEPVARRLRFTPASIILFVIILGVGLVARNVISQSTRVLGWLGAAAIVAALLHPFVAALSRRVPRAVALLVVVVVALVSFGGLAYATVDDLSREATKLKQAAPDAARSIEQSERFGEAARDFGLTERVTEFVDALPGRITGSAANPLSAASRGIAYVAGIVLAIFLMLYGPRTVDGAARQIGDETRRANALRIITNGYRRWWLYVVLSVGRSLVAGLFAFLICHLAGLPAAFLLSLAVGVFALIPYVGVLVGSLPIVLLAVGIDPSAPRAIVLFGVFLAYQLAEAFVVQPRVDERTIRIGPAISLLVAMVAFELYGIGGALYGLAAAVFVVAVLDEVAPTDADAVDLAELERPIDQ